MTTSSSRGIARVSAWVCLAGLLVTAVMTTVIMRTVPEIHWNLPGLLVILTVLYGLGAPYLVAVWAIRARATSRGGSWAVLAATVLAVVGSLASLIDLLLRPDSASPMVLFGIVPHLQVAVILVAWGASWSSRRIGLGSDPSPAVTPPP